MNNKKINNKQAEKLFNDILNNSNKKLESMTGSYLYRGMNIRISIYGLNTTERVKALYKRRRDKGLCVFCAKKVSTINPRTKKLYRACKEHREQYDNKKNQKTKKR